MINICRKAFFYEQLKLGKSSFFEVPINRRLISPFLRSGGCHSSHTHRNAQAHQTAFHCWGCGGDSRGTQARSGNRPPFPQSRHSIARHPLGVSAAGNRSVQVPPPQRDGRRRLGGGERLGERGGYGSGYNVL